MKMLKSGIAAIMLSMVSMSSYAFWDSDGDCWFSHHQTTTTPVTCPEHLVPGSYIVGQTEFMGTDNSEWVVYSVNGNRFGTLTVYPGAKIRHVGVQSSGCCHTYCYATLKNRHGGPDLQLVFTRAD